MLPAQAYVEFYNLLITQALNETHFPVLYTILEIIHQLKSVLHQDERVYDSCRIGMHYYDEFSTLTWEDQESSFGSDLTKQSVSSNSHIELVTMHTYAALIYANKFEIYNFINILNMYDIFTKHLTTVLVGVFTDQVTGMYYFSIILV